MRERERMIKRQDSLLSSSSRRQTAPAGTKQAPNVESIGCMSGIFELIYKYQRRRRKFITLGKKQRDGAMVISSPSSSSPPKEDTGPTQKSQSAPPPAQPTTAVPQLDNTRRRCSTEGPTLVARLMGLEACPVSAAATALPETASEKRQKLLTALEKCDDDLKSLKNIIEALRKVEPRNNGSPPPKPRTPSGDVMKEDVNVIINEIDDDEEKRVVESSVVCCGDVKVSSGEQQPSPVSVLDEFTRSPPPSSSSSGSSPTNRDSLGKTMAVRQQLKKPGEEDHINLTNFLSRMTINESSETKTEDMTSACGSSKAMMESVKEVCEDISWGEKREMGRIGLTLHNGIFRDLIDEAVKELRCIYKVPSSDACNRRLCF